jgi:SAM-dependent methyltransferase
MLACPVCKSALVLAAGTLACSDDACQSRFPIVDGMPILINESSSLFSIQDFLGYPLALSQPPPSIKRDLRGRLPKLGQNLRAKTNLKGFRDLLLAQNSAPTVLVVGAIAGQGKRRLWSASTIDVLGGSVHPHLQQALICDLQDLPFKDGVFDGITVQGVLSQVQDPGRCVDEIYRVLNPEGMVYVETPFMQQIHGKPYDFVRFTYIGHRQLFRRFEEIGSGATGGPGMALAWSYQYFLFSFVTSAIARSAMVALGRITAFWLKYFDNYLLNKPDSLDAASGYYFMGKKGKQAISDRELIKGYRDSSS